MNGSSTPAAEEIVVTGTRASLNRSLQLKKATIGIVDSISAEDIGKFPDQNVAESLQHVPGVSIDRSGVSMWRDPSRWLLNATPSSLCLVSADSDMT